MQKAPVMTGSDLKPLDESKSGDKPIHVFGSNLEARVVKESDSEESKSNAFGNIKETKNEDDIDTIRKRKFDAITGEEDEETVFQGDFKLFAWDLSSSNWVEKGRGQLKLNDTLEEDNRKSRVIMRVGGTLKIVLNVAIKHSTFKIIAGSNNTIRFTDSQTVWAASGSNASLLKGLIEERLESAANIEAEAIQKRPKTSEDDNSHSNLSSSNKDESESKEEHNGDATDPDKEDKSETRESRNEDTSESEPEATSASESTSQGSEEKS